MRRTMVFVMAAVVMCAGAGVAALSRRQVKASAAVSAVAIGADARESAASVAAASDAPALDLSGEWRIDQARSDVPTWGARGGRRGRGGELGDRGSEGRLDGGPGRDRGGRSLGGGRFRMPRAFRIEQKANLLSVVDSTGTVIHEIAVGAPPASGADTGRDSGLWKSDGLHVQRSTPRGTIEETYALEDDGRTLVVRAHIDIGSGRPPRDLKRVYQRVSGS